MFRLLVSFLLKLWACSAESNKTKPQMLSCTNWYKDNYYCELPVQLRLRGKNTLPSGKETGQNFCLSHSEGTKQIFSQPEQLVGNKVRLPNAGESWCSVVVNYAKTSFPLRKVRVFLFLLTWKFHSILEKKTAGKHLYASRALSSLNHIIPVHDPWFNFMLTHINPCIMYIAPKSIYTSTQTLGT